VSTFGVTRMRAQAACQILRRAGVTGGRRTPGRFCARQQGLTQNGVTVKAATGQNHPALDVQRAALATIHQGDRRHAICLITACVDLFDGGVQQ
jgi:hypothetical protein